MDERIEIKKVHDNDKFIITRTIVDEVNSEQLVKIYGEVVQAEKELERQLNEIPAQVKARTAMIEKELSNLRLRKSTLGSQAAKLYDDKEKEALTKANSQ